MCEEGEKGAGAFHLMSRMTLCELSGGNFASIGMVAVEAI